jgi:hypothetical protein
MLVAVNLHEHLVDEEGIAVATVVSLQTVSINGAKLYAPETNRLAGYSDASLGQ